MEKGIFMAKNKYNSEKIKIIAISDTHYKHKEIKIEDCDIIVHCGDFASHSNERVLDFLNWYGNLSQCKYKILIAGNHDTFASNMKYNYMFELCKSYGVIYLENTKIELLGLNIFGSPYSNTFGNWSFMENENILETIWEKITDDIDVLLTHGPAYGILDQVFYPSPPEYDESVGSKTLTKKIFSLKKLKLHIFGHIHESNGIKRKNGKLFVNASSLDFRYSFVNNPFIFYIYKDSNGIKKILKKGIKNNGKTKK
jgi:Icc-related predicted phosphoesterase